MPLSFLSVELEKLVDCMEHKKKKIGTMFLPRALFLLGSFKPSFSQVLFDINRLHNCTIFCFCGQFALVWMESSSDMRDKVLGNLMHVALGYHNMFTSSVTVEM